MALVWSLIVWSGIILSYYYTYYHDGFTAMLSLIPILIQLGYSIKEVADGIKNKK